jgi:transketolase
MAAGFACCGKTVFASTFAMFATGRAWDQVRNTIAYNNFNVKIVATHAGITVGPDGASHQALEDIALMRVIPGMNIIVPCDAPQTREAILACARLPGPCYVRLGRPKFPTIENKPEFKFGKAQFFRQGNDIAIIACGMMLSQALAAAENLKLKGIDPTVINIHTLRPLDSEVLLEVARRSRGIVVCEEHSVIGGLASSVEEAIAESYPVKVVRVGVRDRFGQSGETEELLKEYNLTAGDIEKAALGI